MVEDHHSLICYFYISLWPRHDLGMITKDPFVNYLFSCLSGNISKSRNEMKNSKFWKSGEIAQIEFPINFFTSFLKGLVKIVHFFGLTFPDERNNGRFYSPHLSRGRLLTLLRVTSPSILKNRVTSSACTLKPLSILIFL